MKFDLAIHGKVRIDVKGNLMIIEAPGPWNMEYFHALHPKLAAATKELLATNFGVLLKPMGQAVAVDGCLKYHSEYLKHSPAQCVAVDLTHCHTKAITKDLCKKAYSAACIQFEFFDQTAEALEWLNQELSQ